MLARPLLAHAVRAQKQPRAQVARGVRLARADASTRPLASPPRGYPRPLPPAFARGPSARPRRSPAVVAPSAAAAPAVASAATATTVPEMAVAASVGYLVASFVAFWLGARHPTSRCARYTRSPLPLVPLCVAYLALLVASWSPDTLSLMMPGSLEAGLTSGGWNPQFFPRLDGIMTLLSRRATAASAWMHVACINFFVGRHAALRAAAGGWPVFHTLALTLVFGPVGLCSHWITRWAAGAGAFGARPAGRVASEEAVGRASDRRATGTPYGEAYGNAYGCAYGDGGDARVGCGRGRGRRSNARRFGLLATLMR